jgi:hypothetical protein
MTADQEKPGRHRRMCIYLPKNEYDLIAAQAANSSVHHLSGYCRMLLFGQAPTLFHRNRSLDDFMEEMILLRNDLKNIGNDLNEVVKRFPGQELPEYGEWLLSQESVHKTLLEKIEKIKNKIHSISDQWLQ